MSAETAAILDEAANVIRRNGLHKGDFYAETFDKEPADCPVCVWGAINVAAFGRPMETADDDPMVSFAARQGLRRHIQADTLPAWNDEPDRTAEQVIAALEGAARFEREAGQ